MNMNDLNTVASITLKATASAFLAASLLVGTSFYNNLQPPKVAVPSCKVNTSNFQMWLGDEGRIVSIFEAPIQLDHGTMLCMGTAENGDNEYVEWTGWVTKTTDGPVGMAALK